MDVGDEITVYFTEFTNPPFRMHGKLVEQTEESITIEGTVGEYIGKTIVIPMLNVKMIEVVDPVPERRREYDEFWKRQ